MKIINLISFYFRPDYFYKNKDDLSFIKKNLCLHIDNMESFGWNKDNFIIKTNFDFEYKNIVSIPFEYNDCINLFLTKIVAAYEVLSKYPDTILWQHDHDTYQIKPFNLQQLHKEIIYDVNMCRYWKENNKPQSASVFYKGISKTISDIYEYIKIPNPSFLNNKKYTDEETFMYFQQLGYSINTDLSFEYNTSLTKYTSSKRKSDDPYCVHGNPLRTRWDSRHYHGYLKKSSFKPNQN